MPFSTQDRKAELRRRGLTYADVAAETGVTGTYVYHVINERRMCTGRKSQRIMEYVAKQFGLSVEVVFPVVPTLIYLPRKPERKAV